MSRTLPYVRTPVTLLDGDWREESWPSTANSTRARPGSRLERLRDLVTVAPVAGVRIVSLDTGPAERAAPAEDTVSARNASTAATARRALSPKTRHGRENPEPDPERRPPQR